MTGTDVGSKLACLLMVLTLEIGDRHGGIEQEKRIG